jgi:hypothetical protein
MVAQLRDHKEGSDQRNARVVSIGMGTPALAAHFKSARDLPFTFLVDEKRETYKALAIDKGSTLDLVGPRVWKGLSSLSPPATYRSGSRETRTSWAVSQSLRSAARLLTFTAPRTLQTILPSRNRLRRSIN